MSSEQDKKQAAHVRRSYKRRQGKRKKRKSGRPLTQQYVEPGFSTTPVRLVTPEIERELFPYFVAGYSILKIYKEFGRKYKVSLESLYNARDYYKWEIRQTDIRNRVLKDNNEVIAQRFGQYIDFIDNVIQNAMERFNKGVTEYATEVTDKGVQVKTLEPLKIKDMKDLKIALEAITHLLHGGVQKHEVNATQPLSDDKAAKILEIAASDDNVIDAEAKEINNESND